MCVWHWDTSEENTACCQRSGRKGGQDTNGRKGRGCQIRIRIPPLGRSWLHPKFQNAPQRRSPRRLQLSSDRCRGANAARRIRDAPAWGRHKRAASSRQLGLDTLTPPPFDIIRLAPVSLCCAAAAGKSEGIVSDCTCCGLHMYGTERISAVAFEVWSFGGRPSP